MVRNNRLKKKKTFGMDSIPPVQSKRLGKRDMEMSLTLRYETLARWATEEWQTHHPNRPFLVLWASENCGNNLARQRVKVGRKLKGKAQYKGYQTVDCPFVVPISDYRLPGR